MAIRFDDRIETNVSGDVLITGNQIAVSSKNTSIEIGQDSTFNITIGTKDYPIIRSKKVIKKLEDLPNVLNNIDDDIYALSTKIIEPIINDVKESINSGVTIDTISKFFGDTLMTTTSEINDKLSKITNDNRGNSINLPLITLLSAPIQISTDYREEDIFYTTDANYPYSTSLSIIPKNTLVCIISTKDLDKQVVKDDLSNKYNMFILSERIQILSMPISADDIHNNFETRIANIESLLALK